MSIAIQADIEGILQFEFDLDPEPRATSAIVTAQALIEAEVGTLFDQSEDVTYLTGRGGIRPLLLPRWPVSAVAVELDGVALTDDDFGWTRTGHLIHSSGRWLSDLNGIKVTYTAGWENETKAPAPLRTLVARVAARIWQAGVAFAENQGVAGIRQETIGAYSVTYGDFAQDGSAASTLTEDDVRAARRFARDSVGGIQI
jgi:hypothetical protein